MNILRAGLLLLGVALASSALALDLTPEEQAGKRLYREGLSSAGAQVTALVGAANLQVPASVVPCAGCHGSDGLGRPEGGVNPPSLSWQRLALGQGMRRVNGREYKAYTEGRLARAIQEGVDASGNRLDPAMPRFSLSSGDQRNLTAYLKRLADDRDPGVEAATLRLGTLLPQQGELADAAKVVAALLDGSIRRINEQGGIHGRRLELVSLDPGTDRQQASQALEQLLEQQVFALVTPMAPALGDGLAARLEQAGIPLVGGLGQVTPGPNVFEPLPGLREQLLSVAGYAESGLKAQQGEVQVVYAEPGQQALAQGLQADLAGRGWSQVRVAAFDGQAPTAPAVFFLGSASAFDQLTDALQVAGRTPYLFAASSQVAGEVAQLPGQWSRKVFLAYPFVPGDWTRRGREGLTALREREGLDGRQALLQVEAWCSMLLLEEALKRAGRDASREKLVAALEGLHDVDTGLTPPLSFGPGRRQGLDGAHVVTLELPGPLFYPVAPYRRQ